jgi:ubiquinone/menaquinone biosynthesis C-methylase UbiE
MLPVVCHHPAGKVGLVTGVDFDSVPLEHLHRYSYASELLKGKRVLDLAVREGYGTRLLSETAKLVIGLDADETVVQQAASRHKRDNLQFLAGSGLNMPISRDQAFDAVVCFDAIEEATNLQRLLDEVKRVLTPEGFFVVSAPNEGTAENVFNAKTFSSDELNQFLKARFKHVQLFQQVIYANSTIQSDSASSNGSGHGKTEPQYLFAIASDAPVSPFPNSNHAEGLLSLLNRKEKALRAMLDLRAYQDETIGRQERQLAERKHTIATLEEAFAWHSSRIDSLEKTRGYLEGAIEQLRRSVESQREGLDWRKSQVSSLERVIADQQDGLAWRAQQVEDLETRIAFLERERTRQLAELKHAMTQQMDSALDAIHATAGWKVVLFVRGIRNLLIPEGSARYRFYNRLMGLVRGK